MSQPVKLSDSLVLDARLAGEVFQRSIAGQVEYWARLGRTLEESLNGRQIRALQETKTPTPLSELVATVDTSGGRKRLGDYLKTLPYPHYEADLARPGILIRMEQDGTRKAGRFVNRQFVVDEAPVPVAAAEAVEVESKAASS